MLTKPQKNIIIISARTSNTWSNIFRISTGHVSI